MPKTEGKNKQKKKLQDGKLEGKKKKKKKKKLTKNRKKTGKSRKNKTLRRKSTKFRIEFRGPQKHVLTAGFPSFFIPAPRSYYVLAPCKGTAGFMHCGRSSTSGKR
jgi:hypothetical protein